MNGLNEQELREREEAERCPDAKPRFRQLGECWSGSISLSPSLSLCPYTIGSLSLEN